jgi:fumarate reductase subunit C
MNDRPAYTDYHPRWFRRRVSTYWWVQRWTYVAFILREMSSLFIAWFILYLLMLVAAVSEGKEAYEGFLAWSREPVVLAVNLVTLFFVVFHAATWFNLAPQAMIVHFRGQRVPGAWIAIGNYVAWALVSALLAWLILAG